MPNGFSMMTLAPRARPDSPSMPTTEVNATGGMARWYSRPGVPPISFSARWTAATRSPVLPGSAAANDRFFTKSGQRGSSGLVMQKSAHDCRACSRNCSSVMAELGGADPMSRNSFGSRPAAYRWNHPGSSLRLARSPVAPKITTTWFSGRVNPWLLMVGSGLLLRVPAELRAHRRQDLAR